MIRKAIASIAAATALAAPVALAAPAQASGGGTTILDVVTSVDRYTGSEDSSGLDRFRWDQRNWYDFDILTAAVVANGSLVDDVTSADTAVTLFAPNDRAFQLLAYDLTGKWFSTEQGVLGAIVGVVGTEETLGSVLTYHVVAGKIMKAQVPFNTDIETLNGQTFQVRQPNVLGFIRIADANDSFRDASLVRTDIDAGHSVIHSVSRVLMPTL